MQLTNDIDDARLFMQSVEAICVAATESGNTLNDDLAAALFWGMARLASEAQRLLDGNAEGQQ